MIKQKIQKVRLPKTRSFLDADHDVMCDYYDIIEKTLPATQMLKAMEELIERDPDFYDPYIIAADILFSESKNDDATVFINKAYKRATSRITDDKGNWPDEMLWGYLENRHIMRALEEYGMLLWSSDKTQEALDIFRRILHMNPNDNQGMRHNILAIKLHLSIDAWQEPFMVKDEHGDEIGLDARKVCTWFDKYAPHFPQEFMWLLDYYEKNYNQ
jgi:tetratricopeptide (TPR) repeat protein